MKRMGTIALGLLSLVLLSDCSRERASTGMPQTQVDAEKYFAQFITHRKLDVRGLPGPGSYAQSQVMRFPALPDVQAKLNLFLIDRGGNKTFVLEYRELQSGKTHGVIVDGDWYVRDTTLMLETKGKMVAQGRSARTAEGIDAIALVMTSPLSDSNPSLGGARIRSDYVLTYHDSARILPADLAAGLRRELARDEASSEPTGLRD